MKKTNKKGFTIVELVIVIAVVAILAAVLIPTFVNVVKKANESKDTQLVRNLNTALAVDTAVGKHETMQSALEAAAKAGYDVAKINTSATDNEIFWDSKNDCFVYKKDSGIEYIPNAKTEEATDGDFWKIVADAAAAAANKTYNSYVMGTAELGDMTVANGLDVGENTVKGTITFESNETKTVTIRTNGGTLAVNAPEATVKHYGKADKVTITAVAPHSYHEYGEVLGNIELANGRVVMETGSKAAAIKVNADAAKITDGTAVVSVDTTTSAVSVVVPAEVKTAIEGKEGNGITASEDKIVTDSTVIENMDKFAGGLGTEESPYLIGSNEHFKNIVRGYYSNKLYYRLISDVEVSNNYSEKGIPFVANALNYSELDGADYTLKITDDSLLFNYVNYSEIKNLKAEINDNLVYNACYATFNNVDLSGSISVTGGNQGIYVVYAWPALGKATLTYIDCDCSVDFTSDGTIDSYNAVFTGYAFGEGYMTVLNYTNCTYSGKFVSGKAAMFLGNNSANNGIVTINVNNCKNNGIIQSTVTENYGWNSYVATGIQGDENNKSFKNNSVYLNGIKLTGKNVSDPLSEGFVQGPNDANLKLVQNADGTFTLTPSGNSNVSYYEVSVGLYSIFKEGGTLVQNVKEKIEVSAITNGTAVTTLKKLSFVDETWVNANSGATAQSFGEGEYAYTVYTLNGVEYYYLPNNEKATLNGEVKAPQMISVSCFDNSGKLIASAALSAK